MSCETCATSVDGKPTGCRSNGGCSSGGCNKLNTFDWLAKLDINEPEPFELVEVSFKNGARKGFYYNPPQNRTITGDQVVVEASNGYDVGRITLTGELVRLQMKKKKVSPKNALPKIIRRANKRDLEKLAEARSMEMEALVRARAIARQLGLQMKLGDVEYQGDRRKATFYYTADGRVDFRELIKHYAREFRVKIEMRQIGARQESARIGGLGSCGRELCCSTWLTNFKSVTTGAARYQNLAINQSKLSGQCGRLKCCLNYELDTYLDALQDFPKNPEKLQTEAGTAVLIKTDVFKREMVYTYIDPSKRGKFITLNVNRVKEIMQMNAQNEKPVELADSSILEGEVFMDFDDVTGAVELPMEKRKPKRRGGRRSRRNNKKNNSVKKSSRGSNRSGNNNSNDKNNTEESSKKGKNSRKRGRRRGKGNRRNNQKRNNKNIDKK